MGRSALLAVAAICGSRFALAQQVPPPRAPAPLPGDLEARKATTAEDAAERSAEILYEDALRAETLGKRMMAQQLAQQALEASPRGRYSAAVQRLLDRLTTETLVEEPAQKSDSAVGSRVGYVIGGVFLGGVTGALLGGSFQSSSGSTVAGLGLGGALIGTTLTLATMSAVHDGSMPTNLWAGELLGGWLAASIPLLQGSGTSPSEVTGLIGAGLLVGAIAGGALGAVTSPSGGDVAGGLVLGNLLMSEVVLIEASAIASSGSGSAQLVGGTILGVAIGGFVLGNLLNHQIHWSAGRWGLIFLSAFVGAGLGGLLAGASNSNPSGALGLLAGGEVVGFVVGCLATSGMSPESGQRDGVSEPAQERQGRAMPAMPRGLFSLTF